jgi:ankyrin repeat protein
MKPRTRRLIAIVCSCAAMQAAAAPGNKRTVPKDPLEPARAALRTLQFDKALALLGSAGNSGSTDAQYLLGLMYLNGVGTLADPQRGQALLRSAAEHGHGAAAYVLAGELARDPGAAPDAARQWLDRSAKAGYYRAIEALRSGRPLLDRESVGASDPLLLVPWVMDCALKNDAVELRRLGPVSATVRDDFGRGALSYAARASSKAAAGALLELGADVRAADREGTTALMLAAEKADGATVELLLQRGADPQAVDSEQRTALFYAARANRADNIATLQRAGALLDARDSRGYNALDTAIIVGAEGASNQLRAAGVRGKVTAAAGRRNGKFDPARPGEIYRGWTPLALAVSRNDTSAVQQLLEGGGDPNWRPPQADPLLHVAVNARALQILPLLLARGANAAAADHAGHSVLWLAAIRNDAGLAQALLNAGVAPDTHAAGEGTALLAALRAPHSEVARMLIAAGANAETTDANDRTPLMLACAAGDADLASVLIGRHVKIDAEDREHRTALMHAAGAGSPDVVALLLAAGASASAVDNRKLTALHVAAAQPGAGVFAPLMAADLPVNRRDETGNTPLMIAAATGHVEVVEYLLTHSPNLDIQNKSGDTALIAASRGGYATICQMLLAAGANKSLRNGAGVSAGDVAVGRGFAAIAKQLAGNG